MKIRLYEAMRQYRREADVAAVLTFIWLLDLALGRTPEECTARVMPYAKRFLPLK